MKCPKEKSAIYTGVAVLAAILIGVALSSLSGVIH